MRNHLRKLLTGGAVALMMAMAMLVATPNTAQAVTVRPGASFGQVDVMLDEYETKMVRRDFWAATVTCWNSGVTGQLLALGPCQTMLTVCAARAYYSTPRKRAGVTFAFNGAWCWKY